MKLNNSRSIKMRNFSFFIFTFSLIVMSTLLWGVFSRDSGVVADSKSGLAWQDDYSDNGGEIKKATWQNALVYCEELTLGEQSDWRLPNTIELYGIADRSKYNPAISSVFQNVISYYYWSSTTYVSDSSNAWFVYFSDGGDYWLGKGNESYVRCVRGGQ